MLAVGEHLWGSVGQDVLRMSTALAGGLGCGQQEACGALAGGALVLGRLYGRNRPDEDDAELNRRVCAFRERFLAAFGHTRCAELRASGYGSEGTLPCSTLVEQAARLLLELT